MPDSMMNTSDDTNNTTDESVTYQNMVSNLPLLFAAGYPTSLDKITESQLEKFIPFMVQCSLGHIQLLNNVEYSEPEWWPEDVPFSIPLIKPQDCTTSWHAKLKHIVVICYSFHNGVFLLRFCKELATYQPECLRFINNLNSTTSLYDRISKKLLVTFRNENMLYDQMPAMNNKKTLLPRMPNSHAMDNGADEKMVEPVLFDIYLCDNCEAELYSLDAYMEHEKICIVDDDVIFCGEEEVEPVDENLQQQASFLDNFGLFNGTIPSSHSANNRTPAKRRREQQKLQQQSNSPETKLRVLPRRRRAVMVLSRCPTIAITSPAGQQLINTSKAQVTPEYIMERLDRCERFCPAPAIGCRTLISGSSGIHTATTIRPKFMDKKFNYANISTTFKRPPNSYYHFYTFPRRQFSRRRRDEDFLWLNAAELKKCTPLSVTMKKLSVDDITAYHRQTKLRKLTENRKTNAKRTVVDFIDLCSSDEEDDFGETMADAFDSASTLDSMQTNERVLTPIMTADLNVQDGSLSQTAATPTTIQNGIFKQNIARLLKQCADVPSSQLQLTVIPSSAAAPSSLPSPPPLISLRRVPKPLKPSCCIFSTNSVQNSLQIHNKTVYNHTHQNQENFSIWNESFFMLENSSSGVGSSGNNSSGGSTNSSSNSSNDLSQPLIVNNHPEFMITNVMSTSKSKNHNNNNNNTSTSNMKYIPFISPDVVIERVQRVSHQSQTQSRLPPPTPPEQQQQTTIMQQISIDLT